MPTLSSKSNLVQQEQTSSAQISHWDSRSQNPSNGHRGDPYPGIDYDYVNASQSFTLTDINGIHKTRIVFCQCKLTDPYSQLLDGGIFPATHEQPETGFTFNLLESYHVESLASKKSVYDFITALRRRTNWDFPEDVPDVYFQFCHALRSGQAHNIDSIMEALVPGWPKKNVMVFCFACPQPGFNIDEGAINEEDLQHLITLFLLANGHFGLQKNDILEYVDYMKKVANSTEKSTCVKLKAAQNQNKAKFAGIVTSGVVAITCARHSDWVQWFRACADMQCWQEEVEILSEEFRRAIHGFEKMVLIWHEVAAASYEFSEGFVAYAQHQTYNYMRQAREARECLVVAGGTWPTESVTLAEHIKNERPNQKIDWVALTAEVELQEDEEEAMTKVVQEDNDNDS
uniref:CxC2-like cysteine cluster KDZ transposase-associated domain-containing protein n=1 Tax=Moniliophthora roreri TaxID=221103 RepID=A0A0W0FT55_MONRR